MSQFSSWFWAVAAGLAGLGWLTHKLGLWQKLPAPKQSSNSQGQQQRHNLALSLIPVALAAIFWRLRMRLEALAFLLTGGVGAVVTPLWRWLARRNPHVVEPDDATMYAVASMGVLGAGLWATRKPTVRRFLFGGALAALGMWFSFVDRRSSASPARQRESIALGAGLGALWLGGMVNGLAWLRHSLLRVAGSAEIADPTTPPPTPVAPALQAGDRLTAPIAMNADLERGDILLFGPDGTIGAQSIEFVTRSHYHHMAIYDGDGMVIEAMPAGVVRRPLGARRVTGVRPNIPAASRHEVADWARDHVGDQYDTRGLFLIAFDRVFPGLRLGGPPSHRFSCAVFVADAYMQEGYDLLPNERWQDLVPADFIALIDTPPKVVHAGEKNPGA